MPMSEQHKNALAQGRRESRAIKAYLQALNSRRPGRPVTPDSVRKRIESLDERLAVEEDHLKRLELQQQKIDLEATRKEIEGTKDTGQLERDFIEVAKPYAERKGISYTAWRQVGVSARVLKAAGISRT